MSDDSLALEQLCGGGSLSEAEAHALFVRVMRGEVGEAMLSALLIALKAKGETPDEIAGAARAMREAASPLDTGDLNVADSCGTGGDGAATVNISTAAALVAAAAGLHVAKHGNRSVSSRCGSADVLEQLGVRIEASPELSLRSLREKRICFLFAPQYHAGVRHAMPVRRALGVRTMFNLLGPLANPASPSHQVMGIYDPTRTVTVAHTLGKLGVKRALVVHGGGLDEIALHAPTTAALVDAGVVRDITITPEQAGVRQWSLEDLRGGDPTENASWLTHLLAGRGAPAHNDAVAINAGALLWISDRAADLRDGTARALDILRSGQSGELLTSWVELLREGGDGP